MLSIINLLLTNSDAMSLVFLFTIVYINEGKIHLFLHPK